MKLYKTTYTDDGADSTLRRSWTGSLDAAGKDRKRLKIDGMREIKTDEVNVPTDKTGLLAFLNGK